MPEERDITAPSKNATAPPETYFSGVEFSSLALTPKTHKALATMGYERATHVQAQSIPHMIKGRDVLGSAKTGSGKTLAFMVPAVELLHKTSFTISQGLGVLVLTPTRELAI